MDYNNGALGYQAYPDGIFVYQLHFETPIAEGHTTQHYVGATDCLAARIQAHRLGNGARLTEVAKERGISFKVVRVWMADWGFEKQIKRRKEGPRLCPVCNPGNAYAKAYEGYRELTQEEIGQALIAF